MRYGDYQLIRIAADRGICRATIDHPPINLLDIPLLTEIDRLLREITDDDDVRVLIVDSADPEFFIAHADISLIEHLPPDDTGLHDELSFFHALTEQRPDPAEGHHRRHRGCLPRRRLRVRDGVRHALRRARARTVLGHPELSVGIIPGGGGTQRLPRLVGRGRALEVILGCMDVDAATAEAWGYVDRALPPEELRRFVDQLAARIASCPRDGHRRRQTRGGRRPRRAG